MARSFSFNRKAFFSFVIGLFVCLPLSAQEITLDDVCALLARHAVTEGSFTQEKKLPNSKRILKSSGTFIFSKELIYLHTIKPLDTAMGITPVSFINVTADGNRIITNTKDNSMFQGIASIAVSLFSGDRAALEEHFNTEFSSSATEWTLKLTAKDETIASALSLITLEGTRDAFLTLILETPAGAVTTTRLSNHSYKEALSNDQKAIFTKK